MRITMVCLIVAGLMGCATVDVPTVENPKETIAAAEERGVDDNPDARLHLQMAREAVAEAQTHIEEDDEKLARLALLRADADADLALALVRRDAVRDEVEDVQQRIEDLQSDMDRANAVSQ